MTGKAQGRKRLPRRAIHPGKLDLKDDEAILLHAGTAFG
jgi:hypothetical protein